LQEGEVSDSSELESEAVVLCRTVELSGKGDAVLSVLELREAGECQRQTRRQKQLEDEPNRLDPATSTRNTERAKQQQRHQEVSSDALAEKERVLSSAEPAIAFLQQLVL
jgi:hypothetical protein